MSRPRSVLLFIVLLAFTHFISHTFDFTALRLVVAEEDGELTPLSTIIRRQGFSLQQPAEQEQLVAQSDLPPIHLILTSSATYTIGLLALVNSTLTTASEETLPRLQFHIVSSDDAEAATILDLLNDRFGDRVKDKLHPYGLAEFKDDRLEGVVVWAGYRAASLSQPIVFARYIIPSLLPESIERVIYLDQDVLVQKDLVDLWDLDMEGYPVAAARLCRPSALWRKQFMMGKAPLKENPLMFDHDSCTLNNGVLVYDLKAWRTSSPSYTDELFRWTKLNSEDKLYSLGSQPPFNLVFYRNYKVLDDRWNLMDISGLMEETEIGKGLPWTRPATEVGAASIIHWNGVLKPWLCNGEGHYSEIWTRYFPDYRNYLPVDADEEPFCNNIAITAEDVSPTVEKFTVVIVSFARIDTLIKIAKHLQRSIFVKEIVVAWNNVDLPCPPEIVALPWVRCIPQVANLVHNRFLVWPEITTEGVLHYDDDLIAPLEDLEAAFQIWRTHRDQVLGFEPRVIHCDQDKDSKVGLDDVTGLALQGGVAMPTGCKYGFKLKEGHFDVVIGKLFMVSRHYMQAYFDDPKLIALSNDAPCEDIAMSFVAAHVTPQHLPNPAPPIRPRPPLLFKSNLTEINSKMYAGLSQGISSTIWREKRHDCVQELMGIYGGKRPGPQLAFYELEPVRRRVYKRPIKKNLEVGWCSDKHGSRICRQP